ncbi:hypothetical protein sos41_06940 [Alphaproteobacteria bacterium SO-S41]|nr:hypothetical protein sos41_06940 [Alphaproteobacteria bacterium SO-S41]
MDDGETRALVHRFFDAIERRDVDEVAKIYAPGMAFWFNVTGRETTAADNLATMSEGYKRHRRRTYNDRIVRTFEGGFVVQYTLNIVQHDGRTSSLWACLVGLCRDGRITRLDEYLDSSKFSQPLPAAKQN